ncbi:hypothetical protein GCM10027038_35290 [Arthrobacter bambusae]
MVVGASGIGVGCRGGEGHPNNGAGTSEHDGAENMKNARLISLDFHLDTPQRQLGSTIAPILGLPS